MASVRKVGLPPLFSYEGCSHKHIEIQQWFDPFRVVFGTYG